MLTMSLSDPISSSPIVSGEGRLKIAQPFMAGQKAREGKVPSGTTELLSSSGTQIVFAAHPTEALGYSRESSVGEA
jgi:hypothetical protein